MLVSYKTYRCGYYQSGKTFEGRSTIKRLCSYCVSNRFGYRQSTIKGTSAVRNTQSEESGTVYIKTLGNLRNTRCTLWQGEIHSKLLSCDESHNGPFCIFVPLTLPCRTMCVCQIPILQDTRLFDWASYNTRYVN